MEAARAPYLPALAAKGGGNGGRLISGRHSRLTTFRSGRQRRRQWRPTDIWPSLEANPHALAASGGSQGTLPSALAAKGGGNGGRLTSGRRWRPTLTLWLPVEAARAPYLPALAANGGGNGGRHSYGRHWRPTITLWLPVEAARALYLMLWPSVEANPHALAASGGSQRTLPDALAASGGSQRTLPDALAAKGGGNGGRLTSGRRWRPTLTLWLPVEAARAPYLPLWPPKEAAMAAD